MSTGPASDSPSDPAPGLTALEAARRIGGPAGEIGGRWLFSPEVLGTAKDNGYPNGFVYYFLGRGGVLGDVDADVISSAFGFFNPSIVRTMWDLGLAVEAPRTAARRYAQACGEYGSRHAAGFTGAARYVELVERLLDGASVLGLSLFAGWRAEQRPDDVYARAYFLTHLLREWRGSAHVAAVASVGITPLQSILTAHGGDRAKMFGWGDSFDDVAHLESQRGMCEERTDEICAIALDTTLDADERLELVNLIDELAVAFAE